MLLQQPLTLILATLTAAVTGARRSGPDFKITLTNSTMRVATEYTGSVHEATVVAGATGTFDQAYLKCVHEVCIPEYHCVLHDRNSSRTVDLGPGKNQIACAIEIGLITCAWELPSPRYEDECRAKPSGKAKA
ncbi:hypothetical protein KVR01_008237 [Diaporthe batatas]|uniref:uncharacterized protein n=1 Tax=Diaporthe batatas TaxID=748121 RepID=UPI001D03AC20|nr:uncharacterized protein KVR01_008237 [Diaporthe batatas]KAG8162472.1 hypothetical protein KVR01_008237 [Diaporthe batatas]